MDAAALGLCEICGRPLHEGPSVDRHHWVPRGHGGRAASIVHLVRRRMIRRIFSDRDLALAYRVAPSRSRVTQVFAAYDGASGNGRRGPAPFRWPEPRRIGYPAQWSPARSYDDACARSSSLATTIRAGTTRPTVGPDPDSRPVDLSYRTIPKT